MGRPRNPLRPEEILDQTLRYVLQHGVSNLSLRPLARALGTTPRNLLYHFGSSDALLVQLFSRIRSGQQAVLARKEAPTLGQACWLAWQEISRPASVKWFKLFFAAQGIALERPAKFRGFLQGSTRDWITWLSAEFEKSGMPDDDAAEWATLTVATFRGFMMDYCSTGDRQRLDASIRRWTQILDHALAG